MPVVEAVCHVGLPVDRRVKADPVLPTDYLELMAKPPRNGGALEREAENLVCETTYLKVRAKQSPLIGKGYFKRRPHPSGDPKTQTAVPAGPRNGGMNCEALDKALNQTFSPTDAPEASLDVVALIAARSGVHPATIAAQLIAWSIGAAR